MTSPKDARLECITREYTPELVSVECSSNASMSRHQHCHRQSDSPGVADNSVRDPVPTARSAQANLELEPCRCRRYSGDAPPCISMSRFTTARRCQAPCARRACDRSGRQVISCSSSRNTHAVSVILSTRRASTATDFNLTASLCIWPNWSTRCPRIEQAGVVTVD